MMPPDAKCLQVKVASNVDFDSDHLFLMTFRTAATIFLVIVRLKTRLKNIEVGGNDVWDLHFGGQIPL